MNPAPRTPPVAKRRSPAALVLPLVAVIGAAWGGWWLLRPKATLAGVETLIRAGRFDEVQNRFAAYLHDNPNDQDARYQLIGISLDRPDPKPDVALAELPRLKPANSMQDAVKHVFHAKALNLKHRVRESEVEFRRALAIDPSVAEAGWGLLNILMLQGRTGEARALAVRQHAFEPDPRDRVRYLLDMTREDAHESAPSSVASILKPVVAQDPDDVNSAAMLGLSTVRDGKIDAGLESLRVLLERRPDAPQAWWSYAEGLSVAGRIGPLGELLDRLPKSVAADPRYESLRGRVAQERHDWAAAARHYQRAWELQPDDDGLAYRLDRVLRLSGKTAEAEALAPRLAAVRDAKKAIRDLYDKGTEQKDLGRAPSPDLYLEFASALETLGRR